MSKSITEQIEDLQNENLHLREYEKTFERLLKYEFGIGKKSLKKMIKKSSEKSSAFEERICNYFSLISPSDKETFLSIICCESSLRFFNSKKQVNNSANQQE